MSESCDVSRLLAQHQAGVIRYIQAKGCSKLGHFEEQARQRLLLLREYRVAGPGVNRLLSNPCRLPCVPEPR